MIKRIIDLLCIICIIFCIFLTTIYLGTGIITGDCNLFGYNIYHVVSPSMEPEIMTDDYILVKKIDSDKLQIGNIVGYKSIEGTTKGFMIFHRIQEINNSIIVKGDNNDFTDEPVMPEQIKYIVLYDFNKKADL